MTRQSPWVLGRYMTIDQVVRPRRHEAVAQGTALRKTAPTGQSQGGAGKVKRASAFATVVHH